MQASSAILNHAAAPEAASSSHRMIRFPTPMDHFCPSHKSHEKCLLISLRGWNGCTIHCRTEMVPLRNMLTEMGWKQPRSPIQIYNSTATGYVNKTIEIKQLKAIDMRLDWLRCREAQGQFRFFWDKSTHNLANYHTKHHPPAFHIAHRATHAGWISSILPNQRVFQFSKVFFQIFKYYLLSCMPWLQGCVSRAERRPDLDRAQPRIP